MRGRPPARPGMRACRSRTSSPAPRRRAAATRCRRARGSRTAGTCRAGPFNANHSESWLAVKPGTEDLVGTSKFFFDKYSTFYMFYLGAYQIPGGTPAGNNQVQGYDCVSTGTQAMPPSWTNTTDPNADFDTKGRVYQTMLPFNSFFDATKLHPDGEIDVSYSDDLGRHWVKGNGGEPLEPPNNASAKQAGHVEDKQWVAVNHIAGNRFQDHVYAAWAVFNGNGGGIKVRMAVSRDRGQTFGKAVTISAAVPSRRRRHLRLSGRSTPPATSTSRSSRSRRTASASTIYVARSTDDARTFSPFVPITTVDAVPGGVSAEHPLPRRHHRELRGQPDLPRPPLPHLRGLGFGRRPDGRQVHAVHRRRRHLDDAGRRQRQRRRAGRADRPVPAVGRGRARTAQSPSRSTTGAQACPNDPSVLPADVGRTNFCIDTSLQAYKDSGSGAVPVGGERADLDSSRGIRSSRDSTSAACRSIRAPEPRIPARPAAGSSATTSGSRSRRTTSTRSWSRPTTPQT